jgi:FkbM family methyltransferase
VLLAAAAKFLGRHSANLETRVLARCKGVVHVGANSGQERFDYARFNLPVMWIEPNPSVFMELKKNIQSLPGQKAIKHLLMDQDGKRFAFNVSTNEGLSSSVFDLHMHKDIWPTVGFSGQIVMKSERFDTVVEHNGIDLSPYDHLVMDVQGAELLALRGFGSLLNGFSSIKTEAADFESYRGSCLVGDVCEFLNVAGFTEVDRKLHARHPRAGAYYDLLFQRTKG